MQMVTTKVFETGKKPVQLEVQNGATLAQVLDSLGTALTPGKALSQNGRRAAPHDAVKPRSIVQLMPAADHG